MKKIEAIIRPENFEKIRAALEEADYDGMTLTEVEGHGRQKGLAQQFKGFKFKVEFLPKLKLEIVAVNEDVPKLVQAILGTSRGGQAGDGKIFIHNIEEAIRVRDGEKGDRVVSSDLSVNRA